MQLPAEFIRREISHAVRWDERGVQVEWALHKSSLEIAAQHTHTATCTYTAASCLCIQPPANVIHFEWHFTAMKNVYTYLYVFKVHVCTWQNQDLRLVASVRARKSSASSFLRCTVWWFSNTRIHWTAYDAGRTNASTEIETKGARLLNCASSWCPGSTLTPTIKMCCARYVFHLEGVLFIDRKIHALCTFERAALAAIKR